MFNILKLLNSFFIYARQNFGLIVSFISLFLIRKNIKLIKEKELLKEKIKKSKELNKINHEIIKKLSKVDDANDINGNIERMRDKDL